jgi:hypothetical protein
MTLKLEEVEYSMNARNASLGTGNDKKYIYIYFSAVSCLASALLRPSESDIRIFSSRTVEKILYFSILHLW